MMTVYSPHTISFLLSREQQRRKEIFSAIKKFAVGYRIEFNKKKNDQHAPAADGTSNKKCIGGNQWCRAML